MKLDPQAPPTDAAAYLGQLAAALGLPGTGAGVRARLVDPRTPLHIENVDSGPLAAVCEKLRREHLRGVAVVMSSRLQSSHHGRGWRAVEVEPAVNPCPLADPVRFHSCFPRSADEDAEHFSSQGATDGITL